MVFLRTRNTSATRLSSVEVWIEVLISSSSPLPLLCSTSSPSFLPTSSSSSSPPHRRSWGLGRRRWLGQPRSRGSRRSSWGGESRSWRRERSILWSESWTSSSTRCTRRSPAWKREKATSRRADCWSWAETVTASACPLVGNWWNCRVSL